MQPRQARKRKHKHALCIDAKTLVKLKALQPGQNCPSTAADWFPKKRLKAPAGRGSQCCERCCDFDALSLSQSCSCFPHIARLSNPSRAATACTSLSSMLLSDRSRRVSAVSAGRAAAVPSARPQLASPRLRRFSSVRGMLRLSPVHCRTGPGESGAWAELLCLLRGCRKRRRLACSSARRARGVPTVRAASALKSASAVRQGSKRSKLGQPCAAQASQFWHGARKGKHLGPPAQIHPEW